LKIGVIVIRIQKATNRDLGKLTEKSRFPTIYT